MPGELSEFQEVKRSRRVFLPEHCLNLRGPFSAPRSPSNLLYPQTGLPVASRSISAAISALTGGRPVRCG